MGKKIILIADDDEMSRKLIKRYLSSSYEIIEAVDGEEALHIAHSQPIDLIILDIIMPKLTGFDVLQQIKCDEKYQDINILVATSIQEKTERKALQLGADDIVFKPYDPIVIKKRIDNLLTIQSQKRELEQALLRAENANTAKTDFLSRISHDMRTPLNGILGITALMKDKVTDTGMEQDLLQLEMSGQYLLNLINDTLDVNKIEVGKLELHPDVFDGRLALNNVLELIQPNLEKKGIHLELKTDNLPFTTLYTDVGRLEQVVMNIFSNAIKFTPEGGTITASMTNISNDNRVIWDRIVIEDSGVGMSQEFLPHLFEAFSQENPGNTGNTTGTGLGMAITKQIVDLMGGTIQVESELGKGTKFTLDIPMQIATSAQIKNWKDRKRMYTGDVSFEGKRILLCEDHPLNAQIARRLLEKKKMIIEQAENGEIGLNMFRASAPGYYNLILMDIRMPVMDGLEATKRIRALDRIDAKEIPIVAMTANAFYEDVLAAQDAGMDAHLGKPIEVSKLYQCLAEMLGIKHQYLKKEILVVDDVEVNRFAIKAALSTEFNIVEACDGEEALKVLEEHKGIDLVITDIQMPNINGLELIKQIRAHEEYDLIPIIANTQFGDPEQEEEILALGANDFVYKPTTPKIVELRVKSILGRA